MILNFFKDKFCLRGGRGGFIKNGEGREREVRSFLVEMRKFSKNRRRQTGVVKVGRGGIINKI